MKGCELKSLTKSERAVLRLAAVREKQRRIASDLRGFEMLKELARKLGLDERTSSRVRNDDVDPREGLAKILGVSLNELPEPKRKTPRR